MKRPEWLVALAIVAGWTLTAWGLALALGVWVWPLAGGLLLLSAAGWRFCWRVARDGLYLLTRNDDA